LHIFGKTCEHYGQFFGSGPGTDFQPREIYDWFLGHPTHGIQTTFSFALFRMQLIWCTNQIKRNCANCIRGAYILSRANSEWALAGFIKIWQHVPWSFWIVHFGKTDFHFVLWTACPARPNTKSMDQITIKTPNSKCRLYWCLIEFIDWRYSQACWYFRPAL
jgi:hypothetical protein